MIKSRHPATLALHAGFRSDPATGASAVPIYATAAYQFRDTDQAADIFNLRELGNVYSRMTNPTNDVLEKRLAELEGGSGAMAVSSGMAAVAHAVQNIARAGDNIVAAPDLYGGVFDLFKNVLRNQGVEVRFVDSADPENFRRATDAKTRAYYGEVLPNPRLNIFPIAEVAAIGRSLGIPLIADNTCAPLLCRPFDHGAAIVIYSLTKWVNGHANGIGGIIIDGGNFDWAKYPERQPALNTSDPSYHGTVWTEMAKPHGPVAYILKARTTLLRSLGSTLSPFNAFLALQGIETLALRMKAHCENALLVVAFLKKHAAIQKIVHPSLYEGVAGERARKYMTGGLGSMIGFEVKGGVKAGKAFINALEMIYHVANIGDTRTLAIHPASTTHSQLSEAEQLAGHITPGYVRLSVGIEHIDDILADMDQALAKAAKA